MSQVYMTAKLNLADGTILYPQVSLDNIVASISDPTLVTVATTTNGKVPVAQLPTTLTVTESNTTVPTAGAVYGALNTKQNTLVEGDNIIHIVNGSTIMADITNLDVAAIDQTATNGVHLVLDGGNTISAVAELVTDEAAGILAGVGDGIALSSGVISADVGSGLKIGTETGNAGKVMIDDAEVSEVLLDERVVSGTTVMPVNDRVVTPGNLYGALSVGQAVDVSCAPWVRENWQLLSTDGGQTWTTMTKEGMDAAFLMPFSIKTIADSSNITTRFGWTAVAPFPKFANGLVYLYMMDIKASQACGISYYDGTVLKSKVIPASSEYVRVYVVTDTGRFWIEKVVGANTTFQLDIKNWRQYEVTALTEDAIEYLANYGVDPTTGIPSDTVIPDNLFRSSTIFQVRDKYLVKQDMVCPWIYTINMPVNSDLTIAAGLSYSIRYSDDSTHKVTVDTIPTDAYGWDSHVQMFVKGTSNVNFQSPLILMNPLRSNSGHNLLIKYRDGKALVYVDDYDAGYVVTVTSGTGEGTLYAAITGATNNYVVFGVATDGQTVDGGTVTFVGDALHLTLNIMGNGLDKTTITGDFTAGASREFALLDLTVSGSTINGITTLDSVGIEGDVYTNSRLFIESADVNGTFYTGYQSTNWTDANYLTRMISTEGTGKFTPTPGSSASGASLIGDAYIEGMEISGFTVTGTVFGWDVRQSKLTSVTFKDCYIHDNQGTTNGVWLNVTSSNPWQIPVLIDGCTISHNPEIGTTNNSAGFFRGTSPSVTIKDTVFDSNSVQIYDDTPCTLTGNIKMIGKVMFIPGQKRFLLDNCTVDASAATNDYFNQFQTTYGADVAGTLTFITKTGKTAHVGPIENGVSIYLTGVLYKGTGTNTIDIAPCDVWQCDNFTLCNPVNTAKTRQVTLSNVGLNYSSVVTGVSKILLVSGTTATFALDLTGNPKVLDASVIVVGTRADTPSGTFEVINGSSVTTLEGIGSYVNKDGTNDFTTSISTVNTSATSGAGSLPVALTGSNKFVRLTNNVTGTVGEATDAVDKTVMTNEYEPIIGGTFSLTSATVNEATKAVTIQSGGTMSIVDIRGGKDSVIDLGGTNIVVSSFTAYISGATITGFAAGTGVNGAVKTIQSGHISATSCTFSGNDGTYGPAVCAVGGSIILSGCSVYGNAGATCEVYAGGSATILRSKESYLEQRVGLQHSATFEFVGNNTLKGIVSGAFSGQSGFVTLASGTTLDLRSNSNPTPINPGGSITFEAGGATVLVNSGTEATSSSYMMDNVTLPAGAKLTNTAVVDLGGTNVGIPGNATASASGCTFTNGNGNPNGGAFQGNALFLSGCNITNCRANNGGAINTASGNLVSCVVSGNSALYYGGGVSIPILSMSYCTITGNTAGSGYGGGGLFVAAGNTANATSCNVSGNVDRKNDGTEFPCDYNIYGSALIDGGTVGTILFNGGTASFAGNVRIDEVKPYNTSSGSVIISSGTTLDLRSNSNPTPINPGGSITVETGGCQVITSAGATVSIAGGTYKKINNDGTTA